MGHREGLGPACGSAAAGRSVHTIAPLWNLLNVPPPTACSYLRLHLPHKVQSERGRAKWDAKKKILSVALPIIREDPF